MWDIPWSDIPKQNVRDLNGIGICNLGAGKIFFYIISSICLQSMEDKRLKASDFSRCNWVFSLEASKLVTITVPAPHFEVWSSVPVRDVQGH